MAVQRAETRGWTAFAAVAASLLALAAVLAGCNLQRPPAPAPSAPRLSSNTGFFFNDDGETAGLAYGVANSDAVDLMLQCEKGARTVEIIDAAHPGAAKGQGITLISGAARSDLPTRVEIDEEVGQPLASAKAATDLPALVAFRKSGKMTVKLGDRERAYSATPGELASVARFFAACEKKKKKG
jgi:hypothetical protein